MGLQTHLGPQLLGTVKSNNPALVTTNNPLSTSWPTFLGTGQTNGVRNLGVGDGTQFGSFVIGATTTFPTSQTGVTLGTQSFTNTVTANFYPGVYTTGPAGQQQFQPMVIPAGSYISALVLDIPTSIAGSGTAFTVTGFNLIAWGAPGTTYAAGQQILNHTGAVTAGRYQVGVSGFLVSSGGIGYMINSGNTDTIIQAQITATATGAGAFTFGSGYIGVNYTIRNPDGSWYPQTPTSPISNPPVITY